MEQPEPVHDDYPKVYLYRRVVQAKLFIDTHFAEPIDLDNIADEAYFSKFHFLRLFKKVYGKAPHQYLQTVRIEKAMHLLRSGAGVSEACHKVGFESVSSFSGLFKRLVGVSPSAYWQQQQEIKALILQAPLQYVPGCFAKKNGWTEKAISEK